MFEEEDDEIIGFLINLRNRLPYKTSYNKRTETDVKEHIYNIQRKLGAGMNINRDIQDERYKYNNLRTKLIDQRKRKEARTALEQF